MSKVLDVRKEESQQVSKIVFYEERADGTALAHNLVKCTRKGLVRIGDGTDEFVLVKNLEHASLLMKALKEAEKLGWFEI